MMAWLRKGPPAEVSADEEENAGSDASDAGEASAASTGDSEPPSEPSEGVPPIGGEPGEAESAPVLRSVMDALHPSTVLHSITPRAVSAPPHKGQFEGQLRIGVARTAGMRRALSFLAVAPITERGTTERVFTPIWRDVDLSRMP